MYEKGEREDAEEKVNQCEDGGGEPLTELCMKKEGKKKVNQCEEEGVSHSPSCV